MGNNKSKHNYSSVNIINVDDLSLRELNGYMHSKDYKKLSSHEKNIINKIYLNKLNKNIILCLL